MCMQLLENHVNIRQFGIFIAVLFTVLEILAISRVTGGHFLDGLFDKNNPLSCLFLYQLHSFVAILTIYGWILLE